ncbi:MAG: hypothetical protein DSY90_05665 [Deltaproteobacteria bacterium]|nr:MAG: hypothetical protein DSY90_05665 [Deltaproteobacteria bacterium]RUA00145.1 MAG: hypothetical protein DSY89_07175 [Deltaproteobacteria bacterium]
MENKKLAAAVAAITAYIKTEEEAVLAMSAPKIPRPAILPITLWGMSGRQAMMQNRGLMQMKTFHRPISR